VADKPILKLQLLDAFDEPIQEAAVVMFRHLRLDEVLKATSEAGRPLAVKGLRGAPNGLYRVEADPACYLASSRFVDMAGDGTTDVVMHFAVDPTKVTKVKFPAFKALATDAQKVLKSSKKVTGFEGLSGQGLYNKLDDIRRAGLLNIVTKCGATLLSGGRTVLSFIEELRDLRGDRFFCAVAQQLRDEVKQAALEGRFDVVSGALHRPPDGTEPAGSFKSRDDYGNLQLTFFAGANGWVADIDIDDANGLGHVFQVLRNELTGRPTHPYDIQQILRRHQQLDTGYRLGFA
jgi:hypothetical protein